MIDRQQIVDSARSMIGTPWRHLCRQPGVALDCAGLVICVGRQIGAMQKNFDFREYSRVPDGHSLISACDEYLINKTTNINQLQIGMIVVVKTEKDPQHVGIVGRHHSGELSIIHATNGNLRKKTCEQRLVFSNRFQFVAAYDFAGVEA